MICITGDTHRRFEKLDLYNRYIKNNHLENDNNYLIIAGDFGFIWIGKELDDYGLNIINKYPFKTLFIDGNHENFNSLYNDYPVEDWNDGKVHRIKDNIYHLMRSQVYNIEGNSILTLGGAHSIDKYYRTPNVSWWEQEDITEEDRKNLQELLYNRNEVDYIITHDAPSHIVRHLSKIKTGDEDTYKTDNNNKVLDELYESNLKSKIWYFGHYHMDSYMETFQVDTDEVLSRFMCLYDKIVPLGEVQDIL